MADRITVLILGENLSGVDQLMLDLQRAGFDVDSRRVETEVDLLSRLSDQPDVLLADFSHPGLDARQALRIVQGQGIDVPTIVLYGPADDAAAVECMKLGAADYLPKERLDRLEAAVEQAVEKTHLRRTSDQTRRALQKSETLNQAVLRSLNAIVAILDREGTILSANEAWEQFARENSTAALASGTTGMSYLDIARRAAEEGDEDARTALLGIQAVIDRSEPYFSHEYAIQTKRRVRWFLLYVTPLDEPDGGAVVTHLEITQRKLAEERLSLLSKALESAGNTVIITDRAGTIVWVNPAFTTLTGYSYGQAVGHYSHLANARAHDPHDYKNMWETILSGKVWQAEMLNRRRDGSTYTAEVTITPVYNERNEITHFIDIEQDVTERKQHERDLESIVIIADALRNARTRSEMLPVILTEMVDILHADTVTISLYDPTANEMIFSLAHGLLTALSGLRLPANEGLLGYLTASREIYLTRNALEETRLKTGLFTEPIALAAVPLLTQGQLVGLLWVGRKAEFSQNEVRLMSATADIAANAIYRSSLFEETEQRLQRLSALHEVDKALTTNLETKVTLGILIEQVVSQLAVHAADVLLWNSQSQTFEFLTGSGFRNILAPALRATGQGLSQRVVDERRVISIPDINAVPAETAARLRMRGEEFAAYFGAPLIIKGEVKGVLEVFNRSPFSPNADWHKFFDQLSAQAAIAIDTAQLVDSLQRSNDNLKTAYEDTIEGWARVLDQKDQVTEGHSRRVTEQTIDLARAAGISENEIVHIRRGALLHDIGKLLIPDEILKKTGPLTEEQWKIMRLHPQYAYDWLWPIEYLRPAIDIPYCHHEHWDGSGYPRGLAGEDIPLAARVFSIIDVFDALSHPRPYRGGWERERILNYIQEQSGKQFDPALVELFLRLVGSIPPEKEDLAAT